MNVYEFPDIVKRALMREAAIDGGHEDSTTPPYLRKYPFRCNIDVNGSPNYTEKGDQTGVFYAA